MWAVPENAKDERIHSIKLRLPSQLNYILFRLSEEQRVPFNHCARSDNPAYPFSPSARKASGATSTASMLCLNGTQIELSTAPSHRLTVKFTAQPTALHKVGNYLVSGHMNVADSCTLTGR